MFKLKQKDHTTGKVVVIGKPVDTLREAKVKKAELESIEDNFTYEITRTRGRPKTESSTPIRVPNSLVNQVNKMIKKHKAEINQTDKLDDQMTLDYDKA